MRTFFALAAIALPVAAMATGPLPLRGGTYVLHGTACVDPAFAAMRRYDGIGLGDPHSHDCRARIVARRGRHYVVDDDCIDTGSGAAPRSTERLVLTILSREAFLVGAGRGGLRYDYCPIRTMPTTSRQPVR